MKKRLIAAILTAVMVVSSLQLQAVSVTAQEMYQETEEASLAMGDADTETRKLEEETAVEDAETESGMEAGTGTQGETAAEGTDTESESEKKEDEADNEDSKENETEKETEEADQKSGDESAVTEDADAEKPKEDETEIEAAEAEMPPETSDIDIASGQYKNVSWVIDANGKLMVEGTGEFMNHVYANDLPDWCEYADSIKSAVIKLTDTVNAAGMFCGCSNLVSVDLSGFDSSKVYEMSNMFWGCSSLTSLDLSGFDTSNVVDMERMFEGCCNLSSLDLRGLDTGKVKYMNRMFYRCCNLTQLDLSSFDTVEVIDMREMFSYCRDLTQLDLSSFDTSQVTNMNQMFSNCWDLTQLNLSSFDTGNVTKMEELFYDCRSLTTIYTPYNLLQSIELPKSRDSDIWYNCDGMEMTELPQNLDYSIVIMKNEIPSKSAIKVTKAKTVYACGEKLNIDDLTVCCYDNWGTAAKVTEGYSTNADSIDMLTPGNKTLEITYNGMTAEVEIIVGIYTVTFTGSGKNDIAEGTPDKLNEGEDYTFTIVKSGDYTCTVTATMGGNPITLSPDESGNTYTISNVRGNLVITIEAPEKFIASGHLNEGCSNVTWGIDTNGKLTVEGRGEFGISYDHDSSNYFSRMPWSSYRNSIVSAEINLTDTTDAGYMFAGCQNLTSVDLSGFDTSDVTYMRGMFDDCRSLKSIDLSGLDTGKVTDMVTMFSDCRSLTSINLSGLDTGKVTNMAYMFFDCCSLKSIDLSGLDTGKVTDMNHMFDNCESLTNLDLSSLDTGNVTNMSGMFNGCEILTSINLSGLDTSKVSNMSEMFVCCYQLTSLDLSSFDTSNVINMDGMFYLCAELTTVYTPYNISQSVELPKMINGIGHIWYNCDGEVLTELPQNLDYSIVIMRDKIPTAKNTISVSKTKTVYECGDTLNIDDLTVYYYNDKGAVTKITEGYSTNADNIDMSTPGRKKLRITYNGMTARIDIIVGEDDGESQEPEKETGFDVGMGCEDNTYTGSAIKPGVDATYNGKDLVEGIDYTLKYSNNINVGTATVTVIGKGNFAKGNSKLTFEIWQRDIYDAILNGAATNDEGKEILTLASGSKLTPVLYFNNIKLTNKDYVVKDKDNKEITGKILSDADNNTTVFIEGKENGNFCGSREVTLNIVEKKSLIKFTVAVDKTKLNTLTYDGTEHYIHNISGALTITAKDSAKTKMEYGRDYTIVYPSNTISVGTKKFTVVGMGLYTGNVSKSYTIKPAKDASLDVKYNGSSITGNKINTPFTFESSGITFSDKLSVTGIGGEDLYEGKDYKVAYSGNKKVGTNAKCTITFLGNYKGHAKQVVGFEITKADLDGMEVIAADKAYTGKEGIYKSVPYVIEDKGGANVLVKSSNYKTTYYIQDPTNNDGATQMKGKNKVKSGDTVWVKLEAKGKNYSGTKIVSYKVREAQDLSKAKIAFKDAEGKKVNKIPYTGYKITDRHIKAVVNVNLAEDDDDIEVIYVNNINKGKATVIVKGTDTENCKYVGCKTATFKIVARIFSFN